MNLVISVFQIIAVLAGCLTALASVLLFIRLRWPAAALFIIKLFVSALSPLFMSIGMLVVIVGLATDSVFITLIGLYDVMVFLIHIFRVTRPPDAGSGFDRALGADWESQIQAGQKNFFLPKRMVFSLPAVPKPRLEQNLAFATIPGSDRHLLCDLWQAPEGVNPSGLAFIYLFGSAWYLLDKDLGTRPFFSHLAAQGHLIMDVAYRLSPETDMMGMVQDVKRAIAWMRENAASYGVNPNRIVLAGASAGGHLALMAAYTSHKAQFTPSGLEDRDLSVKAVISLYGPNDLKVCYYHTNQHLTTRSSAGAPKKEVPTRMPGWLIKKMGEDYHRLGMDKGFEKAGALAPLFGGHPDEVPAAYALFSPVNHVDSDCPPTLLILGEHDVITQVEATRVFHRRLVEAGVQSVLHILPQSDHAFDLILPKRSPSSHNAIYDVERFLGVMAG